MDTFIIPPDSPKIYSEKFLIRSYHTDVNRKLTLPKLCSFFQDIAQHHIKACGVGWDVLNKSNLFWALSRLKIEITDMPEWQSEVIVKTWSNGISGIMAIRHFQIIDKNGNELAKAVSSWLILNAKTRRIIRPGILMDDFPLNDEWLFDEEPQKIKKGDSMVSFDPIPICYTEIDMNRHMNNVSYIDRILNTYPYEFLLDNQIQSFEINFLKEAKIKDNLNVAACRATNEHLASILSDEGKSEHVRTKIIWSPY